MSPRGNDDDQQRSGDWIWMPSEPDPRVRHLPLMTSYLPTVIITIVYVTGTYLWRQRLLAEKKSTAKLNSGRINNEQWSLIRYLMVLYNFSMVFYSSAIVYTTAKIWLSSGSLLRGLEFSQATEETDRVVIRIGYAFYVSKIIELLDTLFFLLRGKIDQVTFLHVFHHAAMPPSIWWGLKYAPSGIVVSFPLINSFIHVIMYTYYGLAAMGAYKYLWWKEYLTMAQMAQFCLLFLHQLQVFIPGNDLKDPRIFPLAIMIYSSIFLVLFGNFYIAAYLKKQRVWRKQQQEQLLQQKESIMKKTN